MKHLIFLLAILFTFTLVSCDEATKESSLETIEYSEAQFILDSERDTIEVVFNERNDRMYLYEINNNKICGKSTYIDLSDESILIGNFLFIMFGCIIFGALIGFWIWD
jgi:hypothetical protein